MAPGMAAAVLWPQEPHGEHSEDDRIECEKRGVYDDTSLVRY